MCGPQQASQHQSRRTGVSDPEKTTGAHFGSVGLANWGENMFDALL